MNPDEDLQPFEPLTDDEYKALKASIRADGVLVPVVTTEDGLIIDGHHRVKACAELGITDYPTEVFVGDLREAQARLLILNLARRQVTSDQRRDAVVRLKNLGLTQRMISEMTGVPKSTVGRWLHPNPKPTSSPAPNGAADIVESLRARIAVTIQEFAEMMKGEQRASTARTITIPASLHEAVAGLNRLGEVDVKRRELYGQLVALEALDGLSGDLLKYLEKERQFFSWLDEGERRWDE